MDFHFRYFSSNIKDYERTETVNTIKQFRAIEKKYDKEKDAEIIEVMKRKLMAEKDIKIYKEHKKFFLWGLKVLEKQIESIEKHYELINRIKTKNINLTWQICN